MQRPRRQGAAADGAGRRAGVGRETAARDRGGGGVIDRQSERGGQAGKSDRHEDVAYAERAVGGWHQRVLSHHRPSRKRNTDRQTHQLPAVPRAGTMFSSGSARA